MATISSNRALASSLPDWRERDAWRNRRTSSPRSTSILRPKQETPGRLYRKKPRTATARPPWRAPSPASMCSSLPDLPMRSSTPCASSATTPPARWASPSPRNACNAEQTSPSSPAPWPCSAHRLSTASTWRAAKRCTTPPPRPFRIATLPSSAPLSLTSNRRRSLTKRSSGARTGSTSTCSPRRTSPPRSAR